MKSIGIWMMLLLMGSSGAHAGFLALKEETIQGAKPIRKETEKEPAPATTPTLKPVEPEVPRRGKGKPDISD